MTHTQTIMELRVQAERTGIRKSVGVTPLVYLLEPEQTIFYIILVKDDEIYRDLKTELHEYQSVATLSTRLDTK